MAHTLIVYGSTLGNTERVAEMIAETLGETAQLINVTDVTAEAIADATRILFGSSTWGDGELQDDFEAFIDQFTEALLQGKDVAVFGCGDEASYPDEFCSATDIIRERALSCGANIVAENLRVDDDPEDSEDDIRAWAESL